MRVLIISILFLPLSSVGLSKVFLTQEQALKLAFPDSSFIKQETVFLTKDQIKKIEGIAKSKVNSGILNYHIGYKNKNILGYAFFDSHIVRSMPETIMTVLNPNGTVQFVELLEFHEPMDYRASNKWLSLLKDKSLEDNLWIKRGLKNITGSTLTTQSIAESVRKTLAMFQILIKEPKQ